MFLLLFSWFLFCDFPFAAGLKYKLNTNDERVVMAKMLLDLSQDVIKNQNQKMALVAKARQDNSISAPYEVGYMVQTIQEHYRRMLDKWRSTRIDIRKFYGMEVLLYLEEIEHLYWSIKHEVYMLHEIERKYSIKTPMNETHVDPIAKVVTEPRPEYPSHDKYKVAKPFNPKQFMDKILGKTTPKGKPGNTKTTRTKDMHTPKLEFDENGDARVVMTPYTSRRPKVTYFPREYGWDVYEFNSHV